MPKKEKYGEAFISGIQRNQRLTGYVPPAKKVNMTLETMKYFPGEFAKNLKKAALTGLGIFPAIKRRIKKK